MLPDILPISYVAIVLIYCSCCMCSATYFISNVSLQAC